MTKMREYTLNKAKINLPAIKLFLKGTLFYNALLSVGLVMLGIASSLYEAQGIEIFLES